MVCYDCEKVKGLFKSRSTGYKLVCGGCYDKRRDALGLLKPNNSEFGLRIGKYVTGFKPYKLTDGNLKYVEDHKNFDHKGSRGIWIESPRQENEILGRMGNRIAEKGDMIMGHKFGYDGPGEGSDTPEYKEPASKTREVYERTRATMAEVGLEQKDLKEITKTN